MDDNKEQIACLSVGLLVIGAVGSCFLLALVMLASRGISPVLAAPATAHSAALSHIRIFDRFFGAAELKKGQDIYLQYCAACHGPEGRGQFPEAPLAPDTTGRIGAPPHNESGHSWHHSDALLIRYVTEGGFSDLTRFYLMPAFGQVLSDEQVLLVIAYIKSMWTDEQRASQYQLTLDEEASLR